ncbi:MAG: hypothetical protein PVI97_06705 [Candidatus Thiodiazotropha sp.]
MVYRVPRILFVTVILVGCSLGLLPIENAGEHYRQHRDFASLETIYNGFYKGMGRMEVERLLGEPDYSPIDGQYYYSSDRSVYSDDQAKDVNLGLVVDYRDVNGEITERLHEFWLGPIGE